MILNSDVWMFQIINVSCGAVSYIILHYLSGKGLIPAASMPHQGIIDPGQTHKKYKGTFQAVAQLFNLGTLWI